MISRAYFSHMIAVHACDERFTRMARTMGMPEADKPKDFIAALEALKEKCGVADLKMSDYGISRDQVYGQCQGNNGAAVHARPYHLVGCGLPEYLQ